MNWSTEYIGIPFIPNGRSKEGADCWGLVKMVMIEVFGINLPDFVDHDFNKEVNASVIEDNKALVGAERVDDREDGRLVLMYNMGFPSHIGIVVKGHGVLHMERKMGSVLNKWNKLRYEVEGIYDVSQI
jgi:cell wall-associated NlpC family hydrolase